MGGDRSTDSARYLRKNVVRSLPPRDSTFHRVGERHNGIEMRSGDRAKRENERHERGTGGNRVCKQGNRDVSARQPLPHDSRSDHRRHQEKCAQIFGHGPAREGGLHCCPMRSISFLIASWSRLARGRDKNRLILRSSITNASRNARSSSSELSP